MVDDMNYGRDDTCMTVMMILIGVIMDDVMKIPLIVTRILWAL